MDEVFGWLRGVMAAQARGFVVTADKPGYYQLDAQRPYIPNKPPSAYFGAVKTGKRYVSYYLMALYMDKALVDSVTPALKKRMQGMSCFNFTKVDEALAADLGEVTRRCAEAYRERGLL